LIGIRALFPHELRATEAQIRRLPIYAKDGRQVALEDVATVREDPGAIEVVRENQKQVIPVTAVLAGRDLGSANIEAQQRIAAEVKLPQGYSIQYGGLWQTQQESFNNLLSVMVLGALLVFIVMLFQYDAFAEPTCLLIAGLFALASVAPALLLTNTPLDLASFTGAIMIFGMVTTNGIVLMDTVRHELDSGLPLTDAILRAGSLRARPVLITSAIAILTLLPLAFGIGSGAEMQRPLAIAVIGGLVTSPLFTLVLAPTLFYMLRRRRSTPEAPAPIQEPEAAPVAG
jgi:Cu/Ag efflux pump CusA